MAINTVTNIAAKRHVNTGSLVMLMVVQHELGFYIYRCMRIHAQRRTIFTHGTMNYMFEILQSLDIYI